ncbi:hypothetical protein BJ170DRAFT_712668 [Xylariales sp. AK1849]|nr:hypothetical protein BJ170DRAFT_712668 [Xylariales sp. AK1849]
MVGTGSGVSLTVRRLHPRLFATEDEWARLPTQILTDPYMTRWNQAIAERAERWQAQPPTPYNLIGALDGNGVLDTARQVQLYIKHWAYMHRTTRNVKWRDRIWDESVMASGNSTEYFGVAGDNWNSQHWLDIGEFLVAFAFAYDWLYEAWTPEQRNAIMWSLISLRLAKALKAYEDDVCFLHARLNWNCVTNGGIIIASLAIYHEDPTSIAESLLPRALRNARDNCAQAVQTDGTWTETPDYWFFGTQAHAQLSSAIISATGHTYELLHPIEAFRKTGMFHIYNNEFAGKISAYTGYQRDKTEAADSLLLWYKPTPDNASWWSDLSLDRSFADENGACVSMRSSWTSSDGLFVAMKAVKLTGHSAHGNLDTGDFVLDALREIWAVEPCHQNYLSPGYFDGEAQGNKRWQYYRTGTTGQNTILHNGSNQLVTAAPTTRFESSSTVFHDP